MAYVHNVYNHERTITVARYSHQVKNGQKMIPLIVSQYSLERKYTFPSEEKVETEIWDYLHFTTIGGNPSGNSLPVIDCVKKPNSILWFGTIASFQVKEGEEGELKEKHVLMVVYSDAEKNRIWHSCYLIQYDRETYLTPSLYCRNRGRDRESYKSFTHIQPEDRNTVFFSDNIQADHFEIDKFDGSTAPHERRGRLSNDNCKSWTWFWLTFHIETMTVTLDLVKLP
jgi:hypothetical protein